MGDSGTDAGEIMIDAAEQLNAWSKLAYVTPGLQIPLGNVLRTWRRAALLDWAHRHDAWIFEDDYGILYHRVTGGSAQAAGWTR
jgi:DNA-binding transcriptional MocR family regulator